MPPLQIPSMSGQPPSRRLKLLGPNHRIRSKSPHSMDVMHSKIKTGQTLKAIRAAITEEDAAAPTFSDDGNSITDWILEGFHIEDEQ